MTHCLVAEAFFDDDPRHVDHKAWINSVIAGWDALAAVRADVGKSLGVVRPWAAGKEIQQAANYFAGVCRTQSSGLNHGACLDAFSAFSACIKRVLDTTAYRLEEFYAAIFRHNEHPYWIRLSAAL
jgi:hypothetical protein